MRPAKIILLGTILVAATTAAITFAIPIPNSWHGSFADFHAPLAGSSVTSVINLGAALLFTVSARIYKTRLRQIYAGVALGIIITTIGSLQIPIINAFSWWDSAWVNYGLIGLPFLTASSILYISMRALGRLVGLRSFILKAGYAVPIALLAGVVIILTPHARFAISEQALDASNAVAAVCCTLYGIAAIIALQLSKHIGKHYRQAMFWLGVGEMGSALVSVPIIINALLTGVTNGASPAILAVEIITPILQIIAGYVFARASQSEQSVQSGDITNVLDMVTYAAGLVSNPATVDPMLDPMRTITASITSLQQLSAQQQNELFTIYLQLEAYLTNKEPIRTFSQTELRAELSYDLQKQLLNYENSLKNKGMLAQQRATISV